MYYNAHMKTCKKCKIELEDEDFRERKINKSQSIYRLNICKKCESEESKLRQRIKFGYQNQGTPRQSNAEIEGKTCIKCSKCNTFKPLDDFHKSAKNTIFGVIGICKQCRSVARKREGDILTYKSPKFRRRVYLTIKRRAIKLGVKFQLKENDLNIPEFCPYLGIKLEYSGSRDSSPSVDRIDNEKGYTKDNIQVISNLANCMKRDVSINMLRLFANNVLKLHR